MIGIYCITNMINGKKYIGQSTNIARRIAEHKYSCENIPLCNAINKYGFDSFSIEILKTVSDSPISAILLDCYEAHYISTMKTMDREYGYNRTSGGSSGKKLSEDAKKLIGDRHRGWHPTDEQLQRMSDVQVGKPKSDPWEKAMSDNWHKNHSAESIRSMGNKLKGRPKSQEHKNKISQTLKNRACNQEERA